MHVYQDFIRYFIVDGNCSDFFMITKRLKSGVSALILGSQDDLEDTCHKLFRRE
jgi:hypothetical protein